VACSGAAGCAGCAMGFNSGFMGVQLGCEVILGYFTGPGGPARRMLPGASWEMLPGLPGKGGPPAGAANRPRLPGSQDRSAGRLPAGRTPCREIFAELPRDHPGSCYLHWVNIPEPGISPASACSSPPSDT
jgi:hypothetical protein